MSMNYVKRYINGNTFASLRIRNFRLFFIGQAISLTGTWMQNVAQAWLVLQITGSGSVLGLAWALQFAPVLLLGPYSGVIVDRFSKKKLLYATQIAAAILCLLMWILVVTGSVSLWMVYILALGLGIISAIDYPARQTFVYELVGDKGMTNAVSLSTAERYLARVLGPAVAAVIIAVFGIAACFLLNAISFSAVIITLYMMRNSDLMPVPKVMHIRGQFRAGAAYVWKKPLLRYILIMMGIAGALTYEFSVNLPLLAQKTFRGDASTLAYLTSAMGIGSIIGGILIAQRTKATGKMLSLSAFFFGISVIIASVMPTLAFTMLALLIAGYFSVNFISLSNIILQFESKPEMRGRVMAYWTTAYMGSTVVGAPIIGWIGETFSPRVSLGFSGLSAIAAAFIGLYTLTGVKRRVKSLARAFRTQLIGYANGRPRKVIVPGNE